MVNVVAKVLITGSGKRLGKGLALKFAEKKWDVAIHYNNSEESAKNFELKLSKMGIKTILLKADLQNFDEIRNMFDQLRENAWIPDVLINNAGVFPTKSSIAELSSNTWDDVMDINLKATFLTSKLFAEISKENSKIINIASIGGIEVWDKRIPYNVSKAGLIKLTEVLARELSPKICVNCISPGTLLIENEPASEKLISIEKIPALRYGTIDDIFEAVWFFSNCGNYITGNNLVVDGAYRFSR